MDACPEAMEAAPCYLTYDLKRFFKQQGKVFGLFKKIKGGSPKKILERKKCFPQKVCRT
jgi:hypothetical protein